MTALIVVLLLTAMLSVTAFITSTGNIVGVVRGIRKTASSQIETVVNNVVFPAIDLVLAALSFVEVATVYMDHRRHGQIEWAPAVTLFAGLVFNLFAPMYARQIAGV